MSIHYCIKSSNQAYAIQDSPYERLFTLLIINNQEKQVLVFTTSFLDDLTQLIYAFKVPKTSLTKKLFNYQR